MERAAEGIVVRLDWLQRFGLWELARARQDAKNRGIARDRDHHGAGRTVQEWYEGHYIGLKAEYAVARFLDVPLDIATITGADPGYDLIFRGHRVQVKNYYGPGLILTDQEIRACDLAIMTRPLTAASAFCDADPDLRITAERYRPHAFCHLVIVGWTWSAEFRDLAAVRKFPSGDQRVLDGTALRDPYALFTVSPGRHQEPDLAPWNQAPLIGG